MHLAEAAQAGPVAPLAEAAVAPPWPHLALATLEGEPAPGQARAALPRAAEEVLEAWPLQVAPAAGQQVPQGRAGSGPAA